ncbi:MAG: DUF4349 domain-containing protein [Chloroflexi bacterium]|nr:DUF4349 domain-containing protein [Chloroflexota bacterium]
MNRTHLIALLLATLILTSAVIACGGAESGDRRPARADELAAAAPRSLLAAEMGLDRPGLLGLSGEEQGTFTFTDGPAPAPAAPAPADAQAAAPAAASAPVLKEVEVEIVQQESEKVMEEALEDPYNAGEFSEERAALVAQNRIIVRTVQLALEVNDVAASIEEISQSVQRDGGWVVSTDRSSNHFGFISVRVPAAKLDDTLKWMRQVGVDVQSEASTSTDVTDEYYDLRSRVTSLQATEEALIKLLDRAQDVEDALEVQRELARLQVEIESHLGRIKLLEETAAFSLVNISLNLAPQDMRVDAGEDRIFSVGEVARFRATFYPPEGIDDFDFTWDFGDGSNVMTGYSSAPRADGGRITATVHHQYHSDLESPFIVEVTMNGRGEAGVVEGSDALIATVTELPAISVFAGEYLFVEEGEEVEFSGSFTRPDGLTNYQYGWEFSDGSEAVTGAPEEGATTVTTSHVYQNHRPEPFYATLTISAESEAGNVEGTATIEVFVQEAEGFVITGWSAGDNLKDAVRALSGFAQAAGTVAIWVTIFVPVWLVLGVIIYLLVRFRGRVRLNRRRREGRESRSDSGGGEGYLSTAQDGDAEERS